jgi:hypothetical protein
MSSRSGTGAVVAELSKQELASVLGTESFPGRDEFAAWLASNETIAISRPEVDQDRWWTADESWRNWEIRNWTTTRSGVEKGGLDEAVEVLRDLARREPNTPVGIVSVESQRIVWTILTARTAPICAFWVRKGIIPPASP